MSFLCCRWPGALLLILISFSLVLNQAVAVIVNRTIDDSFGDSETRRLPVFLPAAAGVWKDQTCTDCAIRPDTRSAFESTYTSATYNPKLGSVNVTMDFNGTAIYIFFILANNAGSGITSITNCVFKLDGQQVGSFQHSPDLTTTNVEYNVLAFSKTDIPFAEHRFVIATENINFNAYVNFDYAIYTHDDDPVSTTATSLATQTRSAARRASSPATQSSRNTPSHTDATSHHSVAGAVAGGVIGGLACLAIIAIVIWFYIYRPRGRSTKNALLVSDDDLPDPKGRDILPTTNPRGGIPPPVPRKDTTSTFAATRTPVDSVIGQPLASRSQSLIARPTRNTPATSAAPNHSSRPTHTPNPTTSRANPPLHITNPDPQNQELVRYTRQAELNQQLMTMKGEIADLKADLNLRSPTGETSEIHPETQSHEASDSSSPKRNRQTGTVAQLQEQIRMLTEQVANLRSQQSSPWALGLTNEPPPGYTPTMATYSGFPFTPDRKTES